MIVVVVVVKVVVIIFSQRNPLYCNGQTQVHDGAKKRPPFKHESKPHLQIGCWHIDGQNVAIEGSEQRAGPKSFLQVDGSFWQFENSQNSPFK